MCSMRRLDPYQEPRQGRVLGLGQLGRYDHAAGGEDGLRHGAFVLTTLYPLRERAFLGPQRQVAHDMRGGFMRALTIRSSTEKYRASVMSFGGG